MKMAPKIMLLGSGELGKEFVMAAQRLGLHVIACDRYPEAPAMHVADEFEVFDMLDAKALEAAVRRHQPQILVPEIEAIRTEKLLQFEKRGIQVTPSAKAAHLTMNRDAIRDVAAHTLKLKTAKFAYAESEEQLIQISKDIGYPNVVKPVMSSSGKGQSVVKSPGQTSASWHFAVAGMRGDKQKVIVEEFIAFDFEITLLTIKQKDGPTLYADPIGHRQERGDYQESWMPAPLSPALLKKARQMAKKVTDYLGGAGIFGVEFFVTKNEIYFSELSPRPHDTGLVTLVSQNLSQFELHLRAILGLPIPKIETYGPSASAVILATKDSGRYSILGIDEALALPQTELRLFGKPTTRRHRRMGVALARATSVTKARAKATQAASLVRIRFR